MRKLTYCGSLCKPFTPCSANRRMKNNVVSLTIKAFIKQTQVNGENPLNDTHTQLLSVSNPSKILNNLHFASCGRTSTSESSWPFERSFLHLCWLDIPFFHWGVQKLEPNQCYRCVVKTTELSKTCNFRCSLKISFI